jgi:hypothetical protein
MRALKLACHRGLAVVCRLAFCKCNKGLISSSSALFGFVGDEKGTPYGEQRVLGVSGRDVSTNASKRAGVHAPAAARRETAEGHP